MFMCDGGILGQHDLNAEKAFFEGYGKIRFDRTLIGYYKMARKMEDLESFAREALDESVPLEDRLTASRWFARQCASSEL
jgi:hypothetical protein